MSDEQATLDTALGKRPDLLQTAGNRLSRVERAQIRLVRSTFRHGLVDRVIRTCQRAIGSTWIHHCTKHLRHTYGLERIGNLDPGKSYILVANHRSFFDLYVVTAELVRRNLPHRIVFPVRSKFFYDKPFGWLVNGVMSFFAMYPPIFRDRRRLALNLTSLAELAWLLRTGGYLAGIHPEGTRNQGEDPYSFLPAQRGVGKVIQESNATVLPVFVNGLVNNLVSQVKGNFDGTGDPICIVFGAPVDFSDLTNQSGSAREQKLIAERCLEAIGALSQEERAYRSQLLGAERKRR